MKKAFYLLGVTFVIVTSVIFLTAFTTISKLKENLMEDQCTEWQKSSNHYIEFRWCKDPQLFNNTTYQFFNGYTFKVWYYFKISYTNGESFTGNTILDGSEYSDKGSMYKKTPSRWAIEKKLKKNDAGKWIEF
jgi:hypothetical protein